MIWRCVICFVFVGLTLKSLLSHINSAHSHSPDFHVVCGIDGCVKEYRVYNSFWYHIRRTHSDHLGNGRCSGSTMTQKSDDSCHDVLTRQATALVLTAREKHRLSQSGVNDVVAALQQYQASLVNNLRSQVQKVFQQHHESGLEKDVLAVFDQIEDPFASVSTTYRQDDVIKRNFNFVESEEVCVGYTAVMVKKGKKRFLSTVPKCFHYVPLVRSLEQLFSHPRVLALIDEQKNYRNDYLYDITDGELMKSHLKIQTGNGEREIFGALVSLCGDTLAQHELCGFKEGVGFAHSKCRQCECSFEDMQIYFDEDNFEERTFERHVWQCSEIEKANTEYLRSSLKTTYGINRRSKLINFPAFNLIQQTPQDMMHVIFEGIAPLEIKCVLKHLVLMGELDLDLFNAALTGFPYSPVDIRDKPSVITYSTLASSDNKLKQSSGQMIVLLKILPFLIDAAKGTEHYAFILELIEIVQILLAPVISLQTINKLKILIEQHLKHMKALFPDNNITPKQHYLIHTPSQIKRLGPMVRHMCMRFESEHCFFKQWASKINFKNVCKSLIKHNQMYECCQNVDSFDHPIFSNECTLGPTSEVSNMSYLKEKMRAFLGNDEVNHAVTVKWLNLNGNKYIRDRSLIVCAVGSSDLPIFGLVKNIYVINSSLYCFEFQQHNTICYDRDYMSYKIEIPNMAQATELISADNLIDFTPYYSFTHKAMTYAVMKYYLCDVIGLHMSSTDVL
ncbi:hypothetical protein ACER0C_002165 [Sarotherodon galilaeus]